jgi:pyridoxine 5-phosphate synthase
MPRLSINVDHVATLRQARLAAEPDPVTAAALAELAGADQITVHLREDRRHIGDRDVEILRKTVKTSLNLEMAATQEMLKTALYLKPDMVTIVPEKREELTTEGGLEVNLNKDAFAKYIRFLKDAEIVVSLFIDPDLDQIKAAHRVGSDFVEIHTGRYADAPNASERMNEFQRIENAAKLAAKIGLGVNAGHGLNYKNVRQILQIKEIYELSIGHSIVAKAMLVGFDAAVREMCEIVKG